MDAAAVAGAAAGAGGGGGVGGGAPVNNDEGIAGRVCEVSMDVAALQGVRGSVKVKHALRRVTDVGSHGGNNNHAGGGGAQPLGGAVSEGPLEVAAQAWQVMSITLADREAPAGPFNKCVFVAAAVVCGMGRGKAKSKFNRPLTAHTSQTPHPPTASRSSSTTRGRSAWTRSCSAGCSSPSRARRRSCGSTPARYVRTYAHTP